MTTRNEILTSVLSYSREALSSPKKITPIPASGVRITPEDVESIVEAALSFWYTEYKFCARFKRNLGNYLNVGHVTLTNSGSSANLLAITSALDYFRSKGEYIVTCATNFPTTVAPIYQNGRIPIYVDIDPETLSPNLEQFEYVMKKYGNHVAGVIFAHTLGFPFDEPTVFDILRKHDKDGNKWFITDNCFAKGTKITTIDGDKNIEDVKIGDFVLTRQGYKRVIASRKTGLRKVIKRMGITATPDHPFITKEGIKRFDALKASDIIYTWNEKQLSIEEKSITDTQIRRGGISEFIFGIETILSIDKYGLTTLGKFLKDFLFIIKMEVLSIIPFKTLNFYPHKNIQKFTLRSQEEEKRPSKIWNLQEKKPRSGIKVWKEGKYTKELGKNHGKVEEQLRKFVWFVGRNIRHISLLGQKTVLGNAKTEAEVYDLSVEYPHEFLANGILVHNCDALGANLLFETSKQTVGLFSYLSTYSFFPAHHITTAEGGAIATTNLELGKIIDSYGSWGRDCYCLPGNSNTCGKRFSHEWEKLPSGWDHKYTFTRVGYNLKMTELQAALGVSQLERIDEVVEKRKNNFYFLAGAITPHEEFINTIRLNRNVEISPFGFPILVNPMAPFTANELIAFLEENEIRTRRVFAGNITRQPGYQNLPYLSVDLTGSDRVMNDMFWVGCQDALTMEQLEYMEEKISEFMRKHE